MVQTGDLFDPPSTSEEEPREVVNRGRKPREVRQATPEEIEGLLRAVDAFDLDTLQKKVAWLLNRYPETRDSDIWLYKRFWMNFQSEYLNGEYVKLDDLLALQRPTSISRERARIQNEFNLFQASAEVRQRRGKLSEEEREKALAQLPIYSKYIAYADESGKNDDFLVVGAVWFLVGMEQLHIDRAASELRAQYGFSGELHFKEIDDKALPFYVAVIDRVLEVAATISFTSVSLARRGHKNTDETLRHLYYHLLLRSIDHYHSSGRAPLPRSLDLMKDAENPGPDGLLTAELRDRLLQAGQASYDGKLTVDRIVARSSKDVLGLQLADLYTSSISRVLNAKGKRDTPRDHFADYMLKKIGAPQGPEIEDSMGGLTVHLSIK